MILFALWRKARALPVVLAVAVPGGASAPAARALDPQDNKSEAYYQFLIGKMSRLEGALGDAAEHLEQAAGADDSSIIRIELAQTYMRMGELPKAIEHARLAAETSPDSVDARRTLAEAYLASVYKGEDRAGSTSRAIAEYQALVNLAPTDAEARLMLGRLLLQEDRPAEALAQFAALKAAGVDPAQTGLLTARALLRQGKNDEGEAELRAVVALAPRNFEALSTLAQISEAREDWAQTSEFYRRMASLRPTDAALQARLGLALLRAGRGAEAIAVLQGASSMNPSERPAREMLAGALRAVGRPGEALHEMSVLLEYHPDDPKLLLEIGRIHESRSETEQALDVYRRARLAAAAPDKKLPPDLAAGLVLSIAALELDGGNARGALHTLEAIPADGSEIAFEAALLRGRSHVVAGDTAEAVALAQSLVALSRPARPRAALVLLEARLAASRDPGTTAESLAEYSPASRSPRELAVAAEILRKAGFARMGLSILESVLAAHPGDASVHFAIGAFQQSEGSSTEAERHLRRALEIEPGNAAILNYLGYSLADRGRELPYAETLIRRALEHEPLSGAYLDSLGWALLKQNRMEEAEAALLKAADLLAGDGTVREHLGDLYQRKGDMARALSEWKTAQGLRPEDPVRLRKKVLSALKETGQR